MLSPVEKKTIIQMKINQLERQKYELELNLKLYECSFERAEIITATEEGIVKHQKMIEVLSEELKGLA